MRRFATSPLTRSSALTAAVVCLANAGPIVGPASAQTSPTPAAITIARGGDDGTLTAATKLNLSDKKLLIGNAWGARHSAVLHFRGLSVPRGAEIVSARLVLRTTWGNGAVRMRIAGAASDNAAAPTSAAQVAGMRLTQATSSPSYSASALGAPSYGTALAVRSIGPILQEIVNRPGWNAGQAVHLRIADNGSATGSYVGIGSVERGTAWTARL